MFFYYLSEGVISGYYSEQRKINQETKHMTITAQFGLGSSGAPIIDDNGNVIGMVSSTRAVKTKLKSKNNYIQMIIGNCTPADAILKCFKIKDNSK